MKLLPELRREMVRVCHAIDRREYVGGRDGNVSVRLSRDTILITPAGVRKGDVREEDLVVTDLEGKKLSGGGATSSENGLHLRVYERRPDVRAVVHAHPPVATGFAAAGLEMTECVLPEVVVGLGRVPIAPYATPGTPALSQSIDGVVANHDAFLLQNHGAVTVGEDLSGAHQRMETLEHAARILLVSRLLGGANPLTTSEVGELIAARGRYGIREDLAACDFASAGRTGAPAGGCGCGCGGGGAEGSSGSCSCAGPDDDAIVDDIVTRVLRRLGSR